MKVMVFGANGMAGHMIALYLAEQGHDVTGFVKTSNGMFPCIEGDAIDVRKVREILQSPRYDAVINCIGILNRSVDNDLVEGIYINSIFPHLLERTLSGMDTKFIHISTDCVFSGKTGHYQEDSHPDEESYYGRTKALGEVRGDKSLTFRTSIIGPELKKDGIGLFHWFMTQPGDVDGFSNVIWSGVTTLELAKAIDSVLEQDLTGLYHLVNNTSISKYRLLCLFKQHMEKEETNIHKNVTFINDRSLIDTRLELKHKIPSYDVMVQELVEWMHQHSDIYHLYFDR